MTVLSEKTSIRFGLLLTLLGLGGSAVVGFVAWITEVSLVQDQQTRVQAQQAIENESLRMKLQQMGTDIVVIKEQVITIREELQNGRKVYRRNDSASSDGLSKRARIYACADIGTCKTDLPQIR